MTASSTRVLLEAQAHRRRRVLIAFLTADAEGQERALPRPGPLLGGLAVAVCLLVGALVSGLLTTSEPEGWHDGQLVVGRGSGARLVSIRGTLYPVLNATSARLALPATDTRRVQVVDDATIAAAPHGPVLGIPGAPEELPTRASLLPTGWVACPDGSRVQTTITSRPQPPASTGLALTARVADRPAVEGHLLVSGRRYALPVGHEEAVTRYLGLSAPPVTVPRRWVDLFSVGTALDLSAFRLPAGTSLGQSLPPGARMAGRARRVGQLLSATDHGGAISVVLADGTAPLTPFAAAVFRATAPHPLGQPQAVSDADLVATPISAVRGLVPDDWPSALPAAASGTPCARLDAGAGRASLTELVLISGDSMLARPTGSPETVVEPGHGALVRAGSLPGKGRVVLVDATGTASTVVDPSPETLARLGLAQVDPPSVPSAWVGLLRSGPDLAQLVAGPRLPRQAPL